MSENYAALRAAAALTPEEQAKSDAFEHSDGNRRELEMAIAAQSDPEKAAVLRQQYAQLFEGAPRAPDARPSPTPDDGPPSLSMLMAAYRSPSPTPGPVALAQQQSRGTPSLSELMEAYNSGGPAPAPPPDGSSDFVRGFKVATGQTMPLVKGTLGLVGATGENVFGEGGAWSGLKNWGLTGYQEGMQELKPLAKDNDELTTAYAKAKTGDFGALVDWASYGLGYSLSQLLQAGATSVAGGIAGTLTAGPAGGVAGAAAGAVEGGAVRAAAQRMLAPLVAAEIKKLAATTAGKDLSADALKRVAIANVAKTAGQTSALIGYAGAQEAGSIYPEAEEQAKKEGRKLDGADLARVWATSAGAAALEGLTDKLGLDALTGKIHLPGAGGRAARGVIGGAIGAGTEAATEGAQTFLERVGAGQSLADDDALKDYINSAGLGAIGGGPVGAISGALHAKTAQEHKEEADRQFKAASDKLATATDVGDMIAAADDMTRRPNGDIQVTLPKIDQQTKLDQMLDDPAYQKAQDARLKKLQEAVDLHSSLVEAQNTQTPPVTLGDGTVSSPNTPAVEGALVGRQDTAQLPDVQQTPLMQGRYEGPLRDAAVNEDRAAAGMEPTPTQLTSMPSAEPAVRWIDKTPYTDETQARQHLAQLRERAPEFGVNPNDMVLAPLPGVPGAMAVRTVPDRTGVNTAPRIGQSPATSGLSTAREQPISASSPNKYRGNTRFADLTPMSQQQAESRLEVLQDSATRKGNDPKALQIVPHPGSPGKFAIKNMTPATTLSTEPRAPAQDTTQMGPQVIDPAEAYVKLKRSENTPAARAFIQAYDAGRVSRNDVLRAAAADAKRRSNTQLAAESHGFVPPDEPGKTRGEGVARDQETGRWTPPPKMGDLGKKPAGKMLDEPKEEPTDTPEGEDKPEGPSQWDKKPAGPAGGASTQETEKRLANNDEPGNAELKKAWQAKDLPGVLTALGTSNSPTVRRIAELAQRLVKEKTSIAEWPKNDRVRTQHMDPRGIYGFYDPVTDQLVLRPDLKRKNQAIQSKEASEWVAAHEIMHALTSRIIRDPNDQQKKVVAKLSALFDHVRRNWKGDMAYGLTNLHEFVSEGWTNPAFQAKLGQIAYGKKSAWSKFVDFVSQLLGFKDSNALTELLTLSEKLTKGKRGSSGVFGGKVLAASAEKAQNATDEAQTGSTAASGSAAAEYVRGTGAAVPGQPRARVTALGIAERIERVGSQALVGQQVRSAEDLASLAQVYRDPRYETMRVFFTKGDAIVHATGVSARMPGFAPMIPAGWSEQQYFDWFRDQMARTGADGYYLLHNHPSGNPTPSRADSDLTAKISGEVPGFKAHVVINSNRYAVMTEPLPGMQTADVVEKDFGPDLLLQASKPSPVLGKMITGPGDLVSLGKSFQKANYLTIIGRGADGAVRMTAEAPSTILGRDPKALIGTARALMRKSGSVDLFLVGSASDVASTPVKEAMRVGILRDAVSDSGQSAAEQGAEISGDKLLNSTPARSVAEEQFGPDYSRLAGRTVAYPVAVQETGETATVTTDAQQLMRDYDGRIAAMTKLLKCLG